MLSCQRMSQEPQPFDVVHNPTQCTTSDVVLGGLDAAQQQFQSDELELRKAALSTFINYGESGIQAIIRALQDECATIRCAAYSLLQQQPQTTQIKKALSKVSPYAVFEYVRTIERHEWEFCLIPQTQATSKQYPEGRIASPYKKGIRIWNISTGRAIRHLKGHKKDLMCLAITTDTTQLISGSCDHTIKIWDIASGSLLKTLHGHTKRVNTVKVSTDGKLIFSGSQDCSIKIWDITTGKELQSLTGKSSAILDLNVTPDNQFIIACTLRNTVKIWERQSGKLLHTLPQQKPTFVKGAIHPHGRHLYTFGIGDNHINIWDIKTGRNLSEVKIYPDGAPIYMADEDGSTFQCGRELTTCVQTIYFMPDGKTLLISGLNDRFLVWDISNQKEITSYSAPADKSIRQFGLSKDGSTLYGLWVNQFQGRNPTNSLHIWHNLTSPDSSRL